MLNQIQSGLSRAMQAVNKGLDVFRGDVPTVGATAAARVQSTPPAAIALSNWIPALLEASDFEPGRWIAGDWSKVAAFKIEPNVRYRLIAGQPVRFYVKAKLRETFSAVVSATTGTKVLPQAINSVQQDTALPSLYSPEAVVWHKVANVWQRSNINSLVYDVSGIGATIGFDVPAGATEREIYYIHGDGEFRFRAERLLGGVDDSSSMQWNQSFMNIHSADQDNADTNPKFPRDTELVNGQRLVLEVRTSIEIDFNERARNILILKAASMQVQTLDQQALRSAAEIQNRVGV